MKMYYKDRSVQSFRIGIAFLFLLLMIPVNSVVSAVSLPGDESSLEHEISTNAAVNHSSSSEMELLPSETLSNQAEAGLRRALAAMTTRQWTRGWAHTVNSDSH